MPRTILINREDGRDLKTYGVKKVQTNMKFSFIISVVIVFLWCGVAAVDARIINDLKYLEYLNDFDRINVELDDIHKQWPFHAASRPLEEDENDDEKVLRRPMLDFTDRKMYEIPDRKTYELPTADIVNKNTQMYLEGLQNKFEDPVKHDQLSQYRRYNSLGQELLEEARMYPEMNDEEVERDNAYKNSDDSNIAEADEEIPDLRLSLPRPFFPRITTMEKPTIYENSFRDLEEEEEPEEEEILNMKPSFPKAYFPRIAPVDFPTNFKIEGLTFDKPKPKNHDMHHGHEEYRFKEGEEFPHSTAFNEAPVVEDPGEFGVRPTDPRFYRDLDQTEDTVTVTPQQENLIHPYLVKSPYVSKPKMNSRSDLQNQLRSPNSDELQVESFANKDVEVVPFKPDTQADTAGVYIIAIVAGISAAATVGLIAVGIGWYNLQKHMKNAEDSDYPSYGIVGPNKDYEKKERDDAGDRRLAQSAQMYHYQHQKQQIIAMGRNPQGHGSQSDTEEEEDEEGNYTVYECPGLASIEGPLEVKNPMFDDEQLATPSQTPSKATNAEDTK